MNQEILAIFRRAEGRYFNEAEGRSLENYAENLLARVETMAAIERADGAILDDVIAALSAKYPGMLERYGSDAFARVRRDQGQTLRYATLGMLTMDPDFVYDKFAVWLRTIMNALCETEQVVTGYRALIQACRTHLTHDDAEILVPFVEIVLREQEGNPPGQLDISSQGRAA